MNHQTVHPSRFLFILKQEKQKFLKDLKMNAFSGLVKKCTHLLLSGIGCQYYVWEDMTKRVAACFCTISPDTRIHVVMNLGKFVQTKMSSECSPINAECTSILLFAVFEGTKVACDWVLIVVAWPFQLHSAVIFPFFSCHESFFGFQFHTKWLSQSFWATCLLLAASN